MEIFFDLFLPQSCISCGSLGCVLCNTCSKDLVRLRKGYFYRLEIMNFVEEASDADFKIYCFYSYDGVFEKCIKAAKFNPKHFSVISYLVRFIDLPKEYFSKSILVPVPISKERYKERGFNQALMIAQKLSQRFGVPVMDVLTRDRDTTAQFKNKRSERFENLSGAFKIKKFPKLPSNKRIIVVDDICTSGATISEIYKILIRAGYFDVGGFCLSKKV